MEGDAMGDEARRELRPPRGEAEWAAYHHIRRTVLFERRGRFGEYDAAHPDEHRPGHHPLLLFHAGEPVGAIRVDLGPEGAVFRRVAVREDVQRAGHGRAMLALAEAFARARGATRVLSFVDPAAVGFYARCGYARDEGDGDGATVRMTRELPALDPAVGR